MKHKFIKVTYTPEVKGCYGPRYYVPVEAASSVHDFFAAGSIWGGATAISDQTKMYEFMFGEENDPIFRRVLERFNIKLVDLNGKEVI